MSNDPYLEAIDSYLARLKEMLLEGYTEDAFDNEVSSHHVPVALISNDYSNNHYDNNIVYKDEHGRDTMVVKKVGTAWYVPYPTIHDVALYGETGRRVEQWLLSQEQGVTGPLSDGCL